MLNPGLLEGCVAHTPNHRLGSIKRRCVWKLCEGHQILLVLRWHETGRGASETHVGKPNEPAVDKKRNARCPHDPADNTYVACREPREEAVEWPEEAAEQSIENAGQAVRRRTMFLQQQSRQRRRQRERVERRDDRADGDGQCELLVEL